MDQAIEITDLVCGKKYTQMEDLFYGFEFSVQNK